MQMASYSNHVRVQKSACGAVPKLSVSPEGAVLSLHRPFGDDCMASISLSKQEAAWLRDQLTQGLKWPEPGWVLRGRDYDEQREMERERDARVPGWIAE